MDRWLVKRGPPANDTEHPAKKKKKNELQKTRQFREEYIGMGFTLSHETDPPSAQCVLCGELLANSAMKPSHLNRHLSTKHKKHVGKPLSFFKRELGGFKSSQEKLQKAATVSTKALEASYKVALLLAKAKKPFSLAEEIIAPAAVILNETMISKAAAATVKTVPMSNDTVSRRVDKMGTDIVAQVVEKLRAGDFSLQLDESTDISGHAQLVAFARYVDTDDIEEHIILCKRLEGNTTGQDIFNVVNAFFLDNGITWKSCTSVCTDAAAAMTGRHKGLVAFIRKENPDVRWTHCVIHREALASKKMSPELHSVLNDAVKAINFIKARPLNARLFRRLCDNMGAEHTDLLLHTEVRWLSRGRLLNRLFELRNEVCCFLSENASPLAPLFLDNDWLAKLAYLADIFAKLNELNTSLQGRDCTILKLYDRVDGFLKKAALWKRYCAQGDFSCFPQFDAFMSSEQTQRATIKTTVVGHLVNLIANFKTYFPGIKEKSEQLDWVRNPFTVSETNCDPLPVHLREELVDVTSDRGLQNKFETNTLTEFWVIVSREHPELGKQALGHLLQFGSTYLCESTFSAMTLIKTKQRNRLCQGLETSLITAVASLPPRFPKLMQEAQGQVSH